MADVQSFLGRPTMSNRSFADRELILETDGYDFEQFVLEALSASFMQQGLLRRLGRGRDGAIDIVSESSGETTIIECKFVGDLKYESKCARWREVADRLSRNLADLATQPDRSPNSPYRYWLDTEYRKT